MHVTRDARGQEVPEVVARGQRVASQLARAAAVHPKAAHHVTIRPFGLVRPRVRTLIIGMNSTSDSW